MTGVPVISQQLSLVIGGHVDHGKSTIVGRLLADTASLSNGKLEQVRAMCDRNSKPFEYAFLVDALKDEQAQGITIEAARIFFKTAKRQYVIIDAPGHIEFLRNLVTGAARAEAAFLVIDAKSGVQENSRRHGFMMGLLGICQVVVLVNKMDLVGYDRCTFERIESEYREFLSRFDLVPHRFIPVSGRHGENIARTSGAMPWYVGPTMLQALDAFESPPPDTARPFRMAVQGVYKFTRRGDDRRIIAGSIDSGRLSVGDTVVFLPSRKSAKVATIEAFSCPVQTSAAAGNATGFTLREQLYVARGELAARADEPPPRVTDRIVSSIFWLGRRPLSPNRQYILKLGTARVPMRVDAVQRVMDASTLEVSEQKQHVDRNEVAECTLHLARPIACDLASEFPRTSRFVIVDDFEICGGGIVRGVAPPTMNDVVHREDTGLGAWQSSAISADTRAERYGHRATVVLIGGADPAARGRLSAALEHALFDAGAMVIAIGVATPSGDPNTSPDSADERRDSHFRQFAATVSLLREAGLIVVATAPSLRHDNIEFVRSAVGDESLCVVWIGSTPPIGIAADLVVGDLARDAVAQIRQALHKTAIL
jgi:bifunctional enzyme CysN/CysC